MDFHNFFTIYVFQVKESIADIPNDYWWLYLMDFHNFFTIYVF